MRGPWHRLVVALALWLLGAGSAGAQYRFDVWTTDNGLPQNGVRAIAQTPDGYLWFTTFDGLVRFDGVHFTTFGTGNTKGIINDRFTGLFRARDGTLYATTTENGVLTVYRNGVFTSYTAAQVPGRSIQRMEEDAAGEVRFLVEDDNRVSKTWYYLRNGAFVLPETIDPDAEVVRLTGPDGASWTVTPQQAIERRDGRDTVYPLGIAPPGFKLNAFADRDGYLWIGEYAVHRLGKGTSRRFAEADGLPRSINHSFWQDADGSVWFATGRGSAQGIGLVQYTAGTLRAWGKESGLLDSAVFSVFHDREGTAWLATNRGLARLRKNVLQTFSVKNGLASSEVYPLYRDRQDRIWIGTTKGLSRYANGTFSTVDLKPALAGAPAKETWRGPEMSVQSLWEDPKGRMWVGVDGGLFIVEDGRAERLPGSFGQHVYAIHGDRRGDVWVASNLGLQRYRDDRLVASLTAKDGLPNEFMTLIFEDSKGRLWFGGMGGLSAWTDGRLTNYTTREGLVGNYVRTVYEDADGTLWIGTYGEGLSRFKDGRFVNYRVENGLFNNGVFAIQEDRAGHFWISSNRGIYRVKKRELNAFADGKVGKITSVGYGVGDGMLSSECNGGRQPASLADKDGRFWFPTQDGVVVIEPDNERTNDLPPSVVIESATIDRGLVDIGGGLIVPPGRENVEIDYAGISLIKSEQIRFRYRLEGHDAHWVDAGTRRTAYYSYLPPGHYRFVVTAGNSDDVWNPTGASLAVTFQPFFYQTWWFSLACGAGAAAVLVGIWKARVNRYQSRERELASLVARKTEELRLANEELQYLALADGLTGVANRRRFEDFLAAEWRRARRAGESVALLLLDIDHFKLYNDCYGHQAGDECLARIAAALTTTASRSTDLLARFGGEEFAIVLGGTDLNGGLRVAREASAIVRDLRIPHAASPTGEFVSLSIGVAATAVDDAMPAPGLVRAADSALYRAKADGRNCVQWSTVATAGQRTDAIS
jgi:diguanylate cyclase (GGDEF)-like protein